MMEPSFYLSVQYRNRLFKRKKNINNNNNKISKYVIISRNWEETQNGWETIFTNIIF